MGDEIFKIWTSLQVDQGTPYYVGQHGNCYGVSKFLSPSIEERTSSKFLTWGWENENSAPLFVLKNPNPKQRKSTGNRKKLLIVECPQDPNVLFWDTKAEYFRVANDQKILILNLEKTIKEQTLIRLHHQNRHDDDPFVQKMRPEIELAQFNFGDVNIKPLIEESKLVVHGYDSTGILETLSADIPTIAVWRNGIDHVLPWARPIYESMFEAELFFNDPTLAAQKINEVWPEIDLWWRSVEIQTLRHKFCYHFARQSKKPIRDLLKVLKT
jgi:putative transferase (TIGR04331 family)